MSFVNKRKLNLNCVVYQIQQPLFEIPCKMVKETIVVCNICSYITGGNLISHPFYIANIGITQLVHMFMRLKA